MDYLNASSRMTGFESIKYAENYLGCFFAALRWRKLEQCNTFFATQPLKVVSKKSALVR